MWDTLQVNPFFVAFIAYKLFGPKNHFLSTSHPWLLSAIGAIDIHPCNAVDSSKLGSAVLAHLCLVFIFLMLVLPV